MNKHLQVELLVEMTGIIGDEYLHQCAKSILSDIHALHAERDDIFLRRMKPLLETYVS